MSTSIRDGRAGMPAPPHEISTSHLCVPLSVLGMLQKKVPFKTSNKSSRFDTKAVSGWTFGLCCKCASLRQNVPPFKCTFFCNRPQSCWYWECVHTNSKKGKVRSKQEMIHWKMTWSSILHIQQLHCKKGFSSVKMVVPIRGCGHLCGRINREENFFAATADNNRGGGARPR